MKILKDNESVCPTCAGTGKKAVAIYDKWGILTRDEFDFPVKVEMQNCPRCKGKGIVKR